MLTPPTPPDNRQAMVHHPRPPQHPALQARPLRSPLLPRQRRRSAQHRQHLLDLRPARQRGPSKLRAGQSRRRRPHQDHRQRMGPGLRRARQHRRLRPHRHASDSRERGRRVCDDAGWRQGCVGIPQKQKAGREDGENAFKDIPLGRPGTATEAAGAVLAVVSPLMSYVSGQTLSVTGGRNM